MKQLFTFLLLAVTAVVFSQAPQSIPYQAVFRNADGTVISSTAITITFKIHDFAATGEVVYEETHAVTSNSQGLVSMNVGSGTVVTGAFDNINWGGGNKFLHVLMNAGNGNIDLGTQQMMSVPYALYAEDVNVRVSLTGDSLFIGNQVSIVPGVSAANSLYQPGNGVTDIDGNFYPSIIINGQEWMQKNLAVSKYNNGDPIFNPGNIIIPTPDITQWNLDEIYFSASIDTITGSYFKILNPEVELGFYYNQMAIYDERGLCPAGWHVPNSLEWQELNGVCTTCQINSIGDRIIGNGIWYDSNIASNNECGFSALPAGMLYKGGNEYILMYYSILAQFANWDFYPGPGAAGVRSTGASSISGCGEMFYDFTPDGNSIRCIKD
jgi:uncharacterized protein (TIGR02145 family)